MKNHRIFRGQSQKYNKCLFVPSALRGYWPKQYPFSGIDCCNDCTNILKVEKFLQDLGIDTATYKEKCESVFKKGPFDDCVDGIPYIFWISIVFCEIKIANVGKNTSFSGNGVMPYPISMNFHTRNNSEGATPLLDSARTVEEYAEKIARHFFEHNPPGKNDNFLRKSMNHQHYCKDSCDYETWKKAYKGKDGSIIDGNDLPDHFTLLLDWTECECVAEKFAGEGGTVISIDSEKYDNLIGADYRMSYDDEVIKYYSIDTAEKQKGVVTFWPWTFTIDELENNELGKALDFRIETRAKK
jgi:hypothetical protein